MNNLPQTVLDHLLDIVSTAGNIAYLKISPADYLLDSGGALQAFGLNHIRPKRHASEQVLFLKGLIPLPQPKFLLPFVETPSGISADIHLIQDGDDCWVILLDVSQKYHRQRQIQQTGNELSLSLGKKNLIIEQQLGGYVAQNISRLSLNSQIENRLDLTIMFADIRGFTHFCEENPPSHSFNHLNLYLKIMIKSVLSHAGMVDKIMGDAVMAIFGLVETDGVPQLQALQAAEKMISDIRDLNNDAGSESFAPMEIGVGIATGPVAIGFLGNKKRRNLSIIGHFVNLAARQEQAAGCNEIIIDRNTFMNAPEQQVFYSEKEFCFKGMSQEQPFYSRIV